MASESTKNENILQPGEIIKPFVTPELAIGLIRRCYGLTAKEVKEFNSYDDRNFFFRVDTEGHNENPHLEEPWKCDDGFILKITNSKDSLDSEFFDAQNEMILHMARVGGLQVPEPIRNMQGDYKSMEEIEAPATNDWTVNNVGDRPKGKHIVRVLKFISGKILYDIRLRLIFATNPVVTRGHELIIKKRGVTRAYLHISNYGAAWRVGVIN